jgi:hypothetical protein
MKRVEAILTAGLALSLSSCIFKKKQKAIAPPPPPAPVAATSPAPLPQPLSTPQTNVQLPAPQPLTPEALATTMPHEETPETPAPARTPPRRAATPPPVRTEVTPPVQPPATPPPEERTPIQEVLPPTEQRRLAEEADASTREALRVLDQVQSRSLNRNQRSIVDRVKAFLKQAEEAKQRGDMRQASELAARAQVLAKELQP